MTGPAHGLHVSWVYHHMGELLSAMNVFSLAFCFMLLVKGLTVPSTTDSGSSGNWIIDFYWYVADLTMHEPFHTSHCTSQAQAGCPAEPKDLRPSRQDWALRLT